MEMAWKDNTICVIADPRSGSRCPPHHNCLICEHLRVKKMANEDICPRCGRKATGKDYFDKDECGEIKRCFTCPKCGCEWTEWMD